MKWLKKRVKKYNYHFCMTKLEGSQTSMVSGVASLESRIDVINFRDYKEFLFRSDRNFKDDDINDWCMTSLSYLGYY